MKKLISIIAATAIAMSMTTAFAENNADNMQEVLVSVKSRIDIPEEYSKFTSRENNNRDTTEYSFVWRSEDRGRAISVTASGDGIITYYSNYNFDRADEPHMTEMTADEAKAIAEDFVEKINPDYPYDTEVVEIGSASLYSGSREFRIHTIINGVPLDDEGYLTVSGDAGEVVGFNIWYNPLAKADFTSAEELIDRETAQDAYNNLLGLKLVYRNYFDDEKNTFYPVYVPNSDYNEYINAVTGEVEEISYNYSFDRAAGRSGETAETSQSAKDSGLTPQELEEIDNINGLISKSDIEQQIRDNKVLGVPSSLKLWYINLYKDMSEDTYNYTISMNGKETYVNITADAKTGEIKNYSRYSDDDNGDYKAVHRNDETLKALAGAKADDFKYDEDKERYVRYANGIEVESNSAYMVYNGDVLEYYSISYSGAELPSIDGAMSVSDASKAFFGQVDYSPICIETYKEDGVHIVPVYAVTSNYTSINPFTGKAVNWRNEEITGEENIPLTYTDIDGHYAEKYINALAEYGIGFEGGEFNPDAKITQADLLTLLTSVYSGDSVIVMFNNKEQADFAYSRAMSRDIINVDERDDNAVITRETASIYMIRAAGAEEYAKYNDIYVKPFNDVIENKGYIALLNAMGVVNGDGSGNFNPKREITRAEFAVMLYNYLNR